MQIRMQNFISVLEQIRRIKMKRIILLMIIIFSYNLFAQDSWQNTNKIEGKYNQHESTYNRADNVFVVNQSNIYTSTIPINDSIGTVIKLGLYELPAAIYTDDSLFNYPKLADTTKLVRFYVLVGDTTGKSALSNWFLVSKVDSGSAQYNITFKRKVYSSFNPQIFYSFISNPAAATQSVYIRPLIYRGAGKSARLPKAVTVTIKTRYY